MGEKTVIFVNSCIKFAALCGIAVRRRMSRRISLFRFFVRTKKWKILLLCFFQKLKNNFYSAFRKSHILRTKKWTTLLLCFFQKLNFVLLFAKSKTKAGWLCSAGFCSLTKSFIQIGLNQYLQQLVSVNMTDQAPCVIVCGYVCRILRKNITNNLINGVVAFLNQSVIYNGKISFQFIFFFIVYWKSHCCVTHFNFSPLDSFISLL